MKRQFAKNVCLDCIKEQGTNWTKGEASIGKKLFYFEIKHFEEPSEFGIQNGRISKLHITEFRYIKGDEIAYDRDGANIGRTRRGRCKPSIAQY